MMHHPNEANVKRMKVILAPALILVTILLGMNTVPVKAQPNWLSQAIAHYAAAQLGIEEHLVF